MKETKVYVDRDLLSSFYTRSGTDLGKRKWVQAEIVFYNINNIYLYDIKTHDRELVKEVCEKIGTMAHKVGKLVFCEHCYKTNSARAIDEHLLNEILGQIESEFEQKEFEK